MKYCPLIVAAVQIALVLQLSTSIDAKGLEVVGGRPALKGVRGSGFRSVKSRKAQEDPKEKDDKKDDKKGKDKKDPKLEDRNGDVLAIKKKKCKKTTPLSSDSAEHTPPPPPSPVDEEMERDFAIPPPLPEEDLEDCEEEEYVMTDREGYSGSEVLMEGRMGSTGGVALDCDAISADTGPKNASSVSFMANLDVLKDDSTSMGTIYSAIEKELQEVIAPEIAGCGSSSSSSNSIVNVDFGRLKFDNSGCESDLQSSTSGVCLASGVPVDVYYVGDETPSNLRSTVQSAIDGHTWDATGIQAVFLHEVVQTGSKGAASGNSGGSGGGPPPGALGAVGAAAVLAMAAGGYWFWKNSGEEGAADAKAEVDTDPESDDEHKKSVPVAHARPATN